MKCVLGLKDCKPAPQMGAGFFPQPVGRQPQPRLTEGKEPRALGLGNLRSLVKYADPEHTRKQANFRPPPARWFPKKLGTAAGGQNHTERGRKANLRPELAGLGRRGRHPRGHLPLAFFPHMRCW